MDNENFEEFLVKIAGADMNELTDSVNRSIAEEISKRPHIKLEEDLYYIKNAYDYFKRTPIHFLNPLNAMSSGNSDDFKTEDERLQVILDSFDMNEFGDYLKNSDESLMPTVWRFLDEHFNLALKRDDFKAIFDAQSSKAIYQAINNNIEDALTEELKLFIIRLNPILNESEIIFHEPINQVNVLNLNTLIILCKTDDLEKVFDDAWKSLNFKKKYFDRKTSYNLLMTALTTADIDEINHEIESEYLSNS